MKAVIIIITILLASLLAVILITAWQRKKITGLEEDLEIKTRAYSNLMSEYLKLKEAEQIKNENRKEADEKKNDIYNGNPVDNAITGLSKHKKN